MNFKQLEQDFVGRLSPLYEADEAAVLFQMVIEKLSDWSRGQLMAYGHDEVSDELYEQFKDISTALETGMPIQHIFSEAWFYGLKFKVNGAVLIPRPETEELVDWILEVLKQEPAKRLLDVGTGSGCIPISLTKRMPALKTDTIDVSEEALAIAAENARTHEVEINLIHGDILKYESDKKYDIIVSNPPYIKEDEKGEMHQNVLAHEPHLALFVSNENPLVFYKAIADFAVSNLNTGGSLFFEINEYLADETIQMLADKGLSNIELRNDMQGKPRMIRCRQQHG